MTQPNIKQKRQQDDIYKKVDDVYTYPYDRTLRTFKWDEIKDFFCEMSLNQLRLTMPLVRRRRLLLRR